MAYNNQNETTTVLLDIKKNDRGDYLRVSKIEKGDVTSFDIRNMYTNDDGELAFTQKGVRIKDEDMIDVAVAILTSIDSGFLEDIINKAGIESDYYPCSDLDDDLADIEDDLENIDKANFEEMDDIPDELLSDGIESEENAKTDGQ